MSNGEDGAPGLVGVPRAFKYWGFISYSQKDLALAQKLQRGLERLGIPKAIASVATIPPGLGPALRPIFLDITELSANSSLPGGLKDALEASCALIVICGPHASQSRWVNEEISYFLGLGRRNAVFVVLDESAGPTGEISTLLPPALSGAVAQAPSPLLEQSGQPLAIVLGRGGVHERNEMLRLAAGLLQVPFDAFVNRHHRWRANRRRLIAAALASVSLLLLSAAGFFTVDKWHQTATLNAEYLLGQGEVAAAALALEPLVHFPYTWLGGETRGQYRFLASALRYQTGTVRRGKFDLQKQARAGFVAASGDGRRIALKDSATSIDDSPANDWISVFDLPSGREIWTISGMKSVNTLSLGLNGDGSVLHFADEPSSPMRFLAVSTGLDVGHTSFEVGNSTVVMDLPGRRFLIAFDPSANGAHIVPTDGVATPANPLDAVASPLARVATEDAQSSGRHAFIRFGDGSLFRLDTESGEVAPVNGRRFQDVLTTPTADGEVIAADESGRAVIVGPSGAVLETGLDAGAGVKWALLGQHRVALVDPASPTTIAVTDVATSKRSAISLDETIEAMWAVAGSDYVLVRITGDLFFIQNVDRQDVRYAVGNASSGLSVSSISAAFGMHLIGTDNGSVLAINTATGRSIFEKRLSGSEIVHARFLAGERIAGAMATDGSFTLEKLVPDALLARTRIATFEPGEPEEEGPSDLEGLSDLVCPSLAVSASGGRIAVRRANETVEMLELADDDSIRRRSVVDGTTPAEEQLASFGFSPSGRFLYAVWLDGTTPKTLGVADLDSVHPDWLAVPLDISPDVASSAYDSSEGCSRGGGEFVKWAADDRHLYVRSWEGDVAYNVLAVPTGPLRVEPADLDIDPGFDTPAPKFRGSVSGGGRMLSWDLSKHPGRLSDRSSGRVIAEYPQLGYVSSAAFNRDGSRFILTSQDSGRGRGGVLVGNSETGEVLFRRAGFFIDTRDIAFLADGRSVIVNARGGLSSGFLGSYTKSELVDALTGKVYVDLAAGIGMNIGSDLSGGYADIVAFADGRRIFAVSYEGALDVWDAPR